MKIVDSMGFLAARVKYAPLILLGSKIHIFTIQTIISQSEQFPTSFAVYPCKAYLLALQSNNHRKFLSNIASCCISHNSYMLCALCAVV